MEAHCGFRGLRISVFRGVGFRVSWGVFNTNNDSGLPLGTQRSKSPLVRGSRTLAKLP